MRTQHLIFQAPNRPLSINESNRLHWAERQRRLAPWKTLTHAHYRQTYVRNVDDLPSPVRISVTLPFARAGRRDAHNYTSTVVKAVIDSLVSAGLVPDDTPEWVTVSDPILTIDPELRVIVTIERVVE